MNNDVVLDIETRNTFQEIGSRDCAQLRLSVVGVYTSKDDQFRVYTEETLPTLWPVLEHADRIIGFNHLAFDMPVLNNYYPGDCRKLPLLDMMTDVERVLGYRPKLDDLATATLGRGKSGHGLDAVEFWKAGQIEKLHRYCLDDVRITRDLYQFGRDNGHVLYTQRGGAIRKIPVEFGVPVAVAQPVHLTLGI